MNCIVVNKEYDGLNLIVKRKLINKINGRCKGIPFFLTILCNNHLEIFRCWVVQCLMRSKCFVKFDILSDE